jgi:hypothetical protein
VAAASHASAFHASAASGSAGGSAASGGVKLLPRDDAVAARVDFVEAVAPLIPAQRVIVIAIERVEEVRGAARATARQESEAKHQGGRTRRNPLAFHGLSHVGDHPCTSSRALAELHGLKARLADACRLDALPMANFQTHRSHSGEHAARPPEATLLSHGVHPFPIDPSIELILTGGRREFENPGLLPGSARDEPVQSIHLIRND